MKITERNKQGVRLGTLVAGDVFLVREDYFIRMAADSSLIPCVRLSDGARWQYGDGTIVHSVEAELVVRSK